MSNKYRTELIATAIVHDNRLLEEWSNKIGNIYKNDYIRGEEEVSFYLSPTDCTDGEHKAKMPHIHSHSIWTINKLKEKESRWVIPEHMMYRLRYTLAKEYNLIFTKQPVNISVAYCWCGKAYSHTRTRITVKLF